MLFDLNPCSIYVHLERIRPNRKDIENTRIASRVIEMYPEAQLVLVFLIDYF